MKLEETAWKYTVHGVVQRLKRDYRGSKSEATQLNSKLLLLLKNMNLFSANVFGLLVRMVQEFYVPM